MRGHSNGAASQRGLSLIGLLFWAALVAIVALLAIKTFPSINEYLTIKRTVNKIATDGPSTVPEIRAAFDRQKDIEYAIKSITGKDLEVTKENERVVIGFRYDDAIQIYGPVYLLIKYEGRSQ